MKPHLPYHSVISVLFPISILSILFVRTVGASAWLSLIILIGSALVGWLIGAIIFEINHLLHTGIKASLKANT